MTTYFADCCDLFNMVYIYCADVAYFRFLFDFIAIMIGFALFRAFYRGSRRF